MYSLGSSQSRGCKGTPASHVASQQERRGAGRGFQQVHKSQRWTVKEESVKFIGSPILFYSTGSWVPKSSISSAVQPVTQLEQLCGDPVENLKASQTDERWE